VNVYSTESEQVEQLKRWWQQYGKSTLAVIIVTFLASWGWHAWQKQHERLLQTASVVYERLLTSIIRDDQVAAHQQADRLFEHYAHTPYAQLAALILARKAAHDGDLEEAKKKLNWVVKHGENSALKELARVREARILSALNKPKEALALLNKVDDKAYLPLVQDVKGDIYMQMGNKEAARVAYQEALKLLPTYEIMQPLILMKLDNLAVEDNAQE
jgi:predicted negative regulator of RcsB-dependent stress response